jgi:hypothetical protein
VKSSWLLVLIWIPVLPLAGCGGGDVKVTVPFGANIEYPLSGMVVTVPENCVGNPKAYAEFLEKKAPATGPTVTALALSCEDPNHMAVKPPYLIKLDADQVKKLKAGAKLMVVMDGKNKQYPTGVSFE